MSRILSQHGNVIAADFRPRADLSSITISFSFKTELLYEDDHVMMTRTTTSIDGKPLATLHLVGNKITGHIVHL